MGKEDHASYLGHCSHSILTQMPELGCTPHLAGEKKNRKVVYKMLKALCQ